MTEVAFLSTKPIKAENELKMLVFSLFFVLFWTFFPFSFSILGANLGAELGATPRFVLAHCEKSKRQSITKFLRFLF